MAGPAAGTLQTSKHKPARRRMEELLADGEWHSIERIYPLVAPYFDMRVALRTFQCDHRHNCLKWGKPAPAFVDMRNKREFEHALDRGQWLAFGKMMRYMRGLERRNLGRRCGEIRLVR